jgi:hypothetical protein
MKIHLTYFIFEDQIIPKGCLNHDKGCHALWYFFVLASKNRAVVGDGPSSQIIVVPTGDDGAALWMDRRYESIARSVATLYGYSNPSEFWNYWPLVEAEAHRLGIPVFADIKGIAPGKQIIS